MKERPILFSGEMVRAILEGRKTQTRRIVKDCLLSPYQKGMILWVRETWAQLYKNGEYCLHGDDAECHGDTCDGCYFEYRADNPQAKYPGDWEEEFVKESDEDPKWRPSIHMPRWASRITLEITNVRVERLQDITTGDAWEEGCPISDVNAIKLWFKPLWEKLHGIGSWESNPWVWCISFRRITNA